jgi:hypothetical protein
VARSRTRERMLVALAMVAGAVTGIILGTLLVNVLIFR